MRDDFRVQQHVPTPAAPLLPVRLARQLRILLNGIAPRRQPVDVEQRVQGRRVMAASVGALASVKQDEASRKVS
jgi:hypothetical protein